MNTVHVRWSRGFRLLVAVGGRRGGDGGGAGGGGSGSGCYGWFAHQERAAARGSSICYDCWKQIEGILASTYS